MKILIIPSWYPNGFTLIGGIFFKEQAEALAKYGHDVSVLSISQYSVREILKYKKIVFKNNDFIENGVATYTIEYPSIPKLHTLRDHISFYLFKRKFKKYVEYEIIATNNYYIMERLSNIVLSDREVDSIVSQLSSNCSKIQLKDIKDELFKNISQIENRIKTKIYFPVYLEVDSCPMHGDFTRDNIMKNKRGNLVLIDLDRFTFNGIKGLDFLHYKIDKYSKLQGITFFELLLTDEYIKNELSYFYLVYRVCQEHKENISLNEAYYSKIKNCVAILESKVI